MSKNNDALTLALLHGQNAINLIENPQPTLKDIDDAKKAFKKAARALSAAQILIEEGVYTVAPDPQATGA